MKNCEQGSYIHIFTSAQYLTRTQLANDLASHEIYTLKEGQRWNHIPVMKTRSQ